MAVDYSKLKSDYKITRREYKSKEKRNGFIYNVYEEIDTVCRIEDAVNFISQYITDEVKMIHFTGQDIWEYSTGYKRVDFKIRFLGDNWKELGITEIKVNTDFKYGYSFLASALREKFTDISVCAKNLNKRGDDAK